MPVTPVYNLLATQVPAIQVPGTFLDPADEVATTAELVAPGDSGLDALEIIRRNAVRLDQIGRQGGQFAYCIRRGLALSDGGGLTLNIGEGVLGVDAGVYLAAQTETIPDSATKYAWLTATGDPQLSDTTAVPTDALVYTGRVKTASNVFTEIDLSGVVYQMGMALYRRTGDYGAPGDTPPTSLVLMTRTNGGLYVWDGPAGKHVPLSNSSTAVASVATTALLDTVLALSPRVDDLERNLRKVIFDLYGQIGFPLPPGLADEFVRSLGEQ
jgi:hypothetical protein